LINRQKHLGERARFYRNKEGRWAFSPKLEPQEMISQALIDRGISPEELKILHKLTEASMALVQHASGGGAHVPTQEDIKKHISLPLT
jgi:hypothetical protein